MFTDILGLGNFFTLIFIHSFIPSSFLVVGEVQVP